MAARSDGKQPARPDQGKIVMTSFCKQYRAVWLLPLLAGLAGGVWAQAPQMGKVAPAETVRQSAAAPLVRIGPQVVRPLPSNGAAANGADGKPALAAGQTLVMRESDHLVGVSNNDLMVVGSDLDGMAAAVEALGLPGVQISRYPKIRLLLVKTRRFEQLQAVHDRLASQYPDARFDLPIQYFRRKPH